MDLKPFALPNVYISHDDKKLYSKNIVPGNSVYGEDLVEYEGSEFRHWNPNRSKLSAFILKGTKVPNLAETNRVLYLGASSGTTASHVSDVLRKGIVYCVEFSERPFRDLVKLCENRSNMVPILANARKPSEYRAMVENVDWLYQDISQRDQVEIFIQNVKMFLKTGGYGIIMIKSRSIDVNIAPKLIYQRVQDKLDMEDFIVIDQKVLEPFQKDHAAFIIQYG
jgi:fibrillarin-like pre-rRNA processing protein